MERENKGRNKFWKGVLVGALVTAFAGLIIVGVATGISVIGRSVIDNQQTQIVESSGTAQPAKQELDMDVVQNKLNTLQQIVNNYYLFDEDMDQVEAGIYKGMLSGLDDPYTVYYTPEEYTTMTEETKGTYCGIGVQVSQNIESGIVTVIRVFPNTPAKEAGMEKGDILYKVEDVEAATEELDMLVKQYIRGEEGTFVNLTMLRGGEEVPMRVERRNVEVGTVEHQLLEDKTGYVMVTQFDVVTGDQFKAAVDDLKAQGMERLVIDLRDNPGGVVDPCVEMAAYILPEDQFDGTILSMATKKGKSERYYCEDGEIRHEVYDGKQTDSRYPKKDDSELDLPIAVLMNGQSASAAEVFAGALRDYGKAVLVGTNSYGKGIVQSLLPLADGSAVKITTAHYYTPDGFDLHKKGLKPDVEVELELDEDLKGQYDVPLDRDNQVQKAIEVLK